MDACGGERLEHRQRSLSAARVVLRRRAGDVQDVLTRERIPFIERHEGLMVRIVGKECGLNPQMSGRRTTRNAPHELDACSIREGMSARDSPFGRLSVHYKAQARS